MLQEIFSPDTGIGSMLWSIWLGGFIFSPHTTGFPVTPPAIASPVPDNFEIMMVFDTEIKAGGV